MKHLRITITCMALLGGTSVFSQTTDYLVTSVGDTLHGKVKILSYETDQAVIKTAAGRKTFKVTQVSTVKINGELYQPQRRGNYKFMKLLKPGYLSLYAYREANQNSYDSWFLVKKDGSSMDVPNLTFKKAMAAFLQDCGQVASEIAAGRLARRDLDNIIDSYNSCIQKVTKQRYEESKNYVANTAGTDSKLLAVDDMREKVEKLPETDNRKNALDLLSDIKEKIKKGQVIPAYQIEGLKEYLGGSDDIKFDLDKFIDTIKKN